MFIELAIVYIFILCSVFLGFFIFILSYLGVARSIDREKVLIYECGFEPFDVIHSYNVIHFYLIGILFVIFDMELIYLVPLVYVGTDIGLLGVFIVILFYFLLFFGFVFEWLVGALTWSSLSAKEPTKEINLKRIEMR